MQALELLADGAGALLVGRRAGAALLVAHAVILLHSGVSWREIACARRTVPAKTSAQSLTLEVSLDLLLRAVALAQHALDALEVGRQPESLGVRRRDLDQMPDRVGRRQLLPHRPVHQLAVHPVADGAPQVLLDVARRAGSAAACPSS